LYEKPDGEFYAGPIVSWPFFGEGRGEMDDIDRGPWKTEMEYLTACTQREIKGIQKESQGWGPTHRPHLPPESHNLSASSDSDDSDSDTSEEDIMYRDYRLTQRSSLLIAHHNTRLDQCEEDMQRFLKHMSETLGVDDKDPEFAPFSMFLHDLSAANIFVDNEDHTEITCIIDWESTTIRPLWHCAQLPSFLNNHPDSEEAQIFREEVAKLGEHGQRWVRAEREREPWRWAHKVIEWDGWEVGLVASILEENSS
jgi:hypothetical protein